MSSSISAASNLSFDCIKNILSYTKKHKNILKFSLINKYFYQYYKDDLYKINNCFRLSKIIKYKFSKNLIVLRCLHSCDCWYETKRLCDHCKKNKIYYLVQHHYH